MKQRLTIEDYEMHAKLYRHIGRRLGGKHSGWFSATKVLRSGDVYSVYYGERMQVYEKDGRPFVRHFPKLVCRFRLTGSQKYDKEADNINSNH